MIDEPPGTMHKVWTETGGWSALEEELLYRRFGDDTTLNLLERSTVDPNIVITWVAWDRLPPSIYVVDFGHLTKYETPEGEELMSVDEIKQSEAWGKYFR